MAPCQGCFRTGVRKPCVPTKPPAPVFIEWLALAQGQPCDRLSQGAQGLRFRTRNLETWPRSSHELDSRRSPFCSFTELIAENQRRKGTYSRAHSSSVADQDKKNGKP